MVRRKKKKLKEKLKSFDQICLISWLEIKFVVRFVGKICFPKKKFKLVFVFVLVRNKQGNKSEKKKKSKKKGCVKNIVLGFEHGLPSSPHTHSSNSSGAPVPVGVVTLIPL